MLNHEGAIVQHIERHASDHSLLLFDTKPAEKKKSKRFYFDKRWIGKPGFVEMIRKVWDTSIEGSVMYQVAMKIKLCRIELLKWSLHTHTNLAKKIEQLKKKLEEFKDIEGNRDWATWIEMKGQLAEAYKEEECCWS